MLACPVCGTPNQPSALRCSRCATPLSGVEERRPPPKPTGRQQTIIGLSPETPFPEQKPLGGQKTVLLPNPAASVGAESRSPVPFGQTIVGFPPTPSPPKAGEMTDPRSATALGFAGGLGVEKKQTLLGVAMPGIAPLHPGAEPPAAPPTEASPESSAELSEEELRLAHAHRPRHSRWLAWLLLGAGVLLLSAGLWAWRAYRHAVGLTVTVTHDEMGRQVLHVQCPRCDPGTECRVGATRAELPSGSGRLTLPTPLALGDNRLELMLVKRGELRGTRVAVTVPVFFRLRADISRLASDPPTAVLIVDALPGSRVTVDEKPVSLNPEGHAELAIDASRELVLDAEQRTLYERRVRYVIEHEKKRAEGEIPFRSAITPLTLFTPGERLITAAASFPLSGRTAPKTKLIANGYPLVVGADGSFAQDMAISRPGTTHLRLHASTEGMAARLAIVELEQVTDLRTRALELAATALRSTDQLLASPSSEGQLAALTGELLEENREGRRTRMVVDLPCAQGPCLGRVDYGGGEGHRTLAVHSFVGNVTSVTRSKEAGTVVALNAWLVLPGALPAPKTP